MTTPTDIADFVNERVVGTSVQSTTSLLSPAEACNLTSAVPTGTQEIFLKKGINPLGLSVKDRFLSIDWMSGNDMKL